MTAIASVRHRCAMLSTVFALLLAAPADDGFVPLFDGKTLDGWTVVLRDPKDPAAPKPDPAATFVVTDGYVRCTGKPNGYLATAKEYGDYTLRTKWRYPKGTPPTANAGLLVHVQGDVRAGWPTCVEAQMRVGMAGDLFLTAAPGAKLPALTVDPARKNPANAEGRHYFRFDKETSLERPLGEWNEYEVVCKGGQIALAVNGTKANHGTDGALTRGRIALQSEGSEVHYADVRIRTTK